MAEVMVYSTPTCPWCQRTKKFLEGNAIAYKDINVAADKAARDEMVKKSGQLGVPVLDIAGQIMIGFDEAKLREILRIPPDKAK